LSFWNSDGLVRPGNSRVPSDLVTRNFLLPQKVFDVVFSLFRIEVSVEGSLFTLQSFFEGFLFMLFYKNNPNSFVDTAKATARC
jgi:hypothetical protein